MIKIVKQTLYTQFVDDTTGEIFEETREFLDDTIKIPKKTTTTRTKKVKDDGETEPMIHVLENKLQFNNKAIELTEFEADQKVLIDFEKQGRKITPICHLSEKGNRMTKTNTVSYRGQQRETLLQYGDTFIVEPYPDKDGYFKLIGDAPEKEDDIIDVPEIESSDSIDNVLDQINFTF